MCITKSFLQVFLTLCRLEDAKAAHHSSEKFAEVTSFNLKNSNDVTSVCSKPIECHKEHLNGNTFILMHI